MSSGVREKNRKSIFATLYRDPIVACDMPAIGERKSTGRNACATETSLDHQVEEFVRDVDDFDEAFAFEVAGNGGIGLGFGQDFGFCNADSDF